MNSRKTLFGLAAVLAIAALLLLMVVPSAVSADHVAGEDPNDFANISWIAICSILVFIMTPGYEPDY